MDEDLVVEPTNIAIIAANVSEDDTSQQVFSVTFDAVKQNSAVSMSLNGTSTNGTDYKDITVEGVGGTASYNPATGMVTLGVGATGFVVKAVIVADNTTEHNQPTAQDDQRETIIATVGSNAISATSKIEDASLSKASILVTAATPSAEEKESLLGVQGAYTKEDGTTPDLTYTVNLDKRVEVEGGIDVVVKLTGSASATAEKNMIDASEYANVADYTITFADGTVGQFDPSTGLVTIHFDKGESTKAFIAKANNEDLRSTVGGEPTIETIIATVQTDSGLISQDAITGGQLEDVGHIYDVNPVTTRQLTADWSLKVGPRVADLNDASPIPSGQVLGSDYVTTNFDDKIYVGYNMDGTPTQNYGNFTGGLLVGNDGEVTDDRNNIMTVDTGRGNDVFWLRESQTTATRVYLGEGDDEAVLGQFGSAGDTYLFAEAGNDKVTINGNVYNSTSTNRDINAIYLGEGDDILSVTGYVFGSLIDLGSGEIMPEAFRQFYKDGITQLGGSTKDGVWDQQNTDSATSVNRVSINGDMRYSTVKGGSGADTVTVNGDILYSSVINLGAGADTVTVNKLSNGVINTGDGLGDANEDNTVDTVTIGTLSGGEVHLGINDVLSVSSMTGGSVFYTTDDETVTVGATTSNIQSLTGGVVDAGLGTDTLTVEGTGVTINAANLKGFEVIDLGKGGTADANTYATGNKNQYTNSIKDTVNGTVYIKGDSNDTVDLGTSNMYDGLAVTSWRQTGTETVDGTTYNIYSLGGTTYNGISTATIYIDQSITNVI